MEIVAARRLAAAGADCETILVFLRDRGFDKIDSIKTMRMLYSLSMPEAKDMIDHSVAWSDRLHSDI
jgi:ribosomal protein L7/L12